MPQPGNYWLGLVKLPSQETGHDMTAERIRVLLVEEDEDVYLLIDDLLSRITGSRFDLERVGTYDTAREAIHSGGYDVCLLDYQLGGHQGLELVREAAESGCEVPFVILTGQGDYTVDMEVMGNGVADYLVKGQIDASLLERSIRYAVGHQRLQEQIRENSRLISVGLLAASAAHEINNPLTVILGNCELLMAEDLQSPSRSYAQAAHSEAQRAAKIVQNLLMFARKTDIEKRYVDLKPILDRALEMKSHDFKVNNIRAVAELAPDLPQTMVDEEQLLQVILNIVNNAEHECLAHHGGGQLVLRAMTSGTRIRISISDDGPGIPPDDLIRVFEPFFTTKEVVKGTGLGLSIAYRIIRQHDGDLWVESEFGKGATFHIELPIVAPEGVTTPPSAGSAVVAGPTAHLLIVDDEPLIRELFAQLFEKQHYTVDLAANGREAWGKLASVAYDCVLLDLKMPGMSGQELYRLIERYNKELARKVIFITGDTADPATGDFIKAANNPVMSKPFLLEDLNIQVLKLVGSTSGP